MKKNFLMMKFGGALFLVFAFILCCSSMDAVAEDDGTEAATAALIGPLCKAIGLLTGGIGRSIAIIVLISLGIMLLLGKVSWGVAIAFGLGVGIIFGAQSIMGMLSTGGTDMCKKQ